MNKKQKVLLCFEKYCDLNPDMKLTNSYHNFLNTFSQNQSDYIYHILHYDECYLVYGKHVDEVLADYCQKWDIKIIIFILLGGSHTNPTEKSYKKLKEMGVYLCFHWPDTGPGWGLQTIMSLQEYANLHVSWDNPISDYHSNFIYPKNHMHLWVPQDPSFFHARDKKDIEISFAGSTRYPDRQQFLSYIKNFFPDLLICGGQREANLTPELYAEVIRRSKISLNFSLSCAGFYQTKGRIFEIFASKSMLLEYKNPSTRKYFDPNIDYVEFENGPDLVEKINYYISHPQEAEKIAENGHAKYNSNYSAFHFWKKIMDRIESEL